MSSEVSNKYAETFVSKGRADERLIMEMNKEEQNVSALKKVTFLLPKELHNTLKVCAIEEDVKISDIVAAALRRYLNYK